jgi:hypothetical protein
MPFTNRMVSRRILRKGCGFYVEYQCNDRVFRQHLILEMQDNTFTGVLINITSLYGAYECVIGLLSRKK